jgi:hypothetical protein
MKGPRKRAFRLRGLSSPLAFAESMGAGAICCASHSGLGARMQIPNEVMP